MKPIKIETGKAELNGIGEVWYEKIDLKAYGMENIPKKDLDIMYREYQRQLNIPIEELNGHTLDDVFGNTSKKVYNMVNKENKK